MTNLSDFLKVKKVRCVKTCGGCLTAGKEYSVLDIRMEIKVKDDEDEDCYWESDRFEPVLDSAENQLQDIELTPEFEASEPKFKVGDKVYCLLLEPKIFTILEVDGDNAAHSGESGKFGYRWWGFKNLCHATTENYERLQATFPDIEFEQPAKELKGSDLARAMFERGDRRIYGYASDNSDNDPHGYECVMRDYDVNSGFGVIMSNARYEFFNPCDPRTGEPLTESILND